MSSLPQPAPHAPGVEGLGETSEAAWIIDIDAARVVCASPAGNAFLNGALREGTSFDAAMPALHVLRRLKAGSQSGAAIEELRTLVIWSADAVFQLRCTCRSLNGAHKVLVRAVESSASSVTNRREPIPDPDRALLAHELRTPLSAITALAEVMKEERLGPMGNPRYLTYAADIHESAQHALSVLAAMVGVGGDRSPRQEPAGTDVHEFVARAMAVMRELARKASVRLEADLGSGRQQLAIDHRSLMQILINLLSNALKFTAPGGEVKIATQRGADGGLTLSVTDTGRGMSGNAIRAGDVRQGSGYGLAVVMALAQANGATVDITSASGGGTRVSIVFPPERVSGADGTAD